jgi:hypothetical protein
VRQRERLLEYAASHIQHMQKALTEMNLQLHHVVADITGSTGLPIIRAILAGERDPEVLAVNVELLSQLSECSIAFDCRKRHLRFEGRCVVPARSSAHGLS